MTGIKFGIEKITVFLTMGVDKAEKLCYNNTHNADRNIG